MSIGNPGGRRTEAERAVLYNRPESLKVRLRPGYKSRLAALAQGGGVHISWLIETLVDQAEKKPGELGRRMMAALRVKP